MLLYNIGRLWSAQAPESALRLRGKDMSRFGFISDAWMRISPEGIILATGTSCPESEPGEERVDMRGCWVFPSFCDSHTHIIYAGSREGEFRDKIAGLSYEEIARRGGGILNSADLLHRTSEDELFESASRRLDMMISLGTGAVEIKSGYGLNTADELKMLRVAARLRESSPAVVRTTFLGAHAVGRPWTGRQQEYVAYVCSDMIPAVAAEGLADFVDVFCDEGFFTPSETARILEAAGKFGIKPKIHANELAVSGGVQVGIEHKALSVDHLERIGSEEIGLLAASDTCATMLPGASFFSNLPYGPARKAIDGGAIVALASDFNPGSSPSGSMPMVVSLACIKMRISPEEAFTAATFNGAYAMGVSDSTGSLIPGKTANFFTTEPLPDLAFFPYAYTTPLIREIWLRGKKI